MENQKQTKRNSSERANRASDQRAKMGGPITLARRKSLTRENFLSRVTRDIAPAVPPMRAARAAYFWEAYTSFTVRFSFGFSSFFSFLIFRFFIFLSTFLQIHKLFSQLVTFSNSRFFCQIL